MSIVVTEEVDNSEVEEFVEKLRNADDLIANLAREIENYLTSSCPIRTGNLLSTIIVMPAGKGFEVYMASYGKFLEWWQESRVELNNYVEMMISGFD